MLASRPVGFIDESTTSLVEGERPVCGEGQALVKVAILSVDPAMRGWMNDAPGYMAPIGLGEVIRSAGSGVVVESKSTRYRVGDVVVGLTGWQEWAVADDVNRFTVVPAGLGLDLATFMNVLGATGLTAYFGLLEVGRFKAGDVVVVSGAAGATGSVAGQIARARGAGKVVGIAGGPDKCAYVTDRLRFDECLDYREPGLSKRLHGACPAGVDLYFDNVGGEVTDAVLANLAMRGRVVVCGAISQYNSVERPPGLRNTSMLIVRRASMEGFLIFDFAARYAEAQAALAEMVRGGEIVHDEFLVEGLEQAPAALNLLFSGANLGKTLVVVDDSIHLS
ncbi:MAG: NADP-dependent oxidoreductase [Acidimicrobiales bacterium]